MDPLMDRLLEGLYALPPRVAVGIWGSQTLFQGIPVVSFVCVLHDGDRFTTSTRFHDASSEILSSRKLVSLVAAASLASADTTDKSALREREGEREGHHKIIVIIVLAIDREGQQDNTSGDKGDAFIEQERKG